MTTASIIINIALGCVAFGAARNTDSIIPRVLGLGFLIARGIMLLALGLIGGGGFLPSILGGAMIAAAVVAWWQAR